ncbi:type II toxin-antitoxin system RelE/ParE family toxin [Leucothrix arctica]|uniref:Plasmid stabilization protein n=1 Tax=Leucothrix arctica TaxID=1481894 RepID=A0A317C598_9GAMM|nr:type II toxin-antitoxin system RelE/ParE family toxin [Leucothrix arctica]PWQ93391.1 plasmid stabilization protein [Leucothrix arctica]
MSQPVEWTSTARYDIEEIIEYIAQDNINTALDVLGRIENRAAKLADLTLRGRLIPELLDTGISHYRELIESPWRIIYRQIDKTVYIVAVLDSRRDLEALLLNRFGRGT